MERSWRTGSSAIGTDSTRWAELVIAATVCTNRGTVFRTIRVGTSLLTLRETAATTSGVTEIANANVVAWAVVSVAVTTAHITHWHAAVVTDRLAWTWINQGIAAG